MAYLVCHAEIHVRVSEGPHHVALGAGTYPDGAQVRVLVAPEVGYCFVRWEGSVPSGLEMMNPLEFVPSGDVELRPTVEIAADPWAGWATTRVVAWGKNDDGQCDVPPGLDHVRAVAAATTYSVVLKMDGTVQGWGKYVPDFEGLFKFGGKAKAISASHIFTFLVFDDGRVAQCVAASPGLPPNAFSWGTDKAVSIAADAGTWCLLSDGRVLPSGYHSSVQKTAVGPNSIVAVAAGSEHGLGLRPDGTVVAWGKNTYGQTNVPPDLPPAVGVAASYHASLTWHADGSVRGWGEIPTNLDLAALTGVTAVSMCVANLLAIRRDGTVLDGRGNPVPGLERVVCVAAGVSHNLALEVTKVGVSDRSTGLQTYKAGETMVLKAFLWGADGTQWYKDGEPLPGATNSILLLPAVTLDDAGRYQVVAWDGSAAVSESILATVYETHITGSGQVEAHWIEETHQLEIRAKPGPGWKLKQWNLDTENYTALMSEETALAGVFVEAEFEPAEPITIQISVDGMGAVAGAGDYYYDNEVVLTAAPEIGWRFARWTGAPPGQEANNPLRLLARSNLHLHAVFERSENPREGWFEGKPLVWQKQFRTLELDAGPISTMSGREYGVLLLRADGRVVQWQSPFQANTNVTDFIGITNGISVSVDYNNKVVAMEDGRIVGETRFPVSLITNAIQVASCWRGVMARLADGTVRTVAHPDAKGAYDPPPGLGKVSSIAAGIMFAMAIKPDTTLALWGELHGRENIVPPADLTNVVAVSSVDQHALALLEDGSVRGWGTNLFGAIQVDPGFTNGVNIATGIDCSAIVTRNGTIVYWGRGSDEYQLSSGMPPIGLQNVVEVLLTADYSVALIGTEVGLSRPESTEYRLQPGERLILNPRFYAARSYAWYKDGKLLPEATRGYLKLGPVSQEDAGTYQVIAFGQKRAISVRIKVSIEVPEPLRLHVAVDRSEGQTELVFDPPLPLPAVIETSTNLWDWQPLTTLPAGATGHYTPWNAELPFLFFRLHRVQ